MATRQGKGDTDTDSDEHFNAATLQIVQCNAVQTRLDQAIGGVRLRLRLTAALMSS